MINTDITGRHYDADAKLTTYIEEKLGGLDRYLPRRDREIAHLQVTLIDDPNGREDNRYVCDAILNVHGTTMPSAEGAINMYASVDIVAAKLRAQLRTYKEKHTTEPRRGKMMNRLMGRKSETDTATPVNQLVD